MMSMRPSTVRLIIEPRCHLLSDDSGKRAAVLTGAESTPYCNFMREGERPLRKLLSTPELRHLLLSFVKSA